MATLAVTNDFSAGAAIVASEMNTNFSDIETFINSTPGVLQLTGGTVTGAVTLSNTLTVGANDTGYDVKLFGATSGAYMLWDEDQDDLVLAGAAGLDIEGDIDVDGTANLDNVDIDGTINQDGVIGRIAPTGVVLPFAGGSIPTGWLLCTGGAVSRTTYANLFGVIGTTYGVGDGSSTFNVPDMQGRVPAGVNTSDSNFVSLNTKVGAATHTLTSGEMPSHTHTQNSHTHQLHSPVDGGLIGSTIGSFGSYYTRANIGDSTNNLWIATATTAVNQNTGGGGAHNNLQPTIALYYIIAT